MQGGSGDDVFVFGAGQLGTDSLADLQGIDLLDLSALTGGNVTLILGSTTTQTLNSNLRLRLLQSSTAPVIENVKGSASSDQITGTGSDNLLSGAGGDDVLSGGSGNDTLEGGPGNDTLDGGLADDSYALDADTALGSDRVTSRRVAAPTCCNSRAPRRWASSWT